MKKYALALLALLLLLPAVLASGEALDVAVPEYVRPYAPAEITVNCPDAGELTLRVSDDYVSYVIATAQAQAGENRIAWDGLGDNAEALQRGAYTLTVTLQTERDTYVSETPLTVKLAAAALQYLIPSGDTVYAGQDGFLVNYLITASGTMNVQLTAEDAPQTILRTWNIQQTDMLPHIFRWNGQVNNQSVPEGRYVLTFSVKGSAQEPYEVHVAVSHEKAPSAPLTVTDRALYLPENLDSDADVWAAMMYPVTVVDVGRLQHQKVFSQPNSKSEVLGTVHGQSQAVIVLALDQDNGYAKVAAWRHEDGEYIEGYVPQKKLFNVIPAARYGILIDKNTQIMTIYEDGHKLGQITVSSGLMAQDKLFRETRAGAFLTTDRMINFKSEGYMYNYAIRIDGGNLIHSLGCKLRGAKWDYSEHLVELGKKASHGCVRMDTRMNEQGLNAYWVWTHIPYYTKVLVIDDPQARAERLAEINAPAATQTPAVTDALAASEQPEASPDAAVSDTSAPTADFTPIPTAEPTATPEPHYTRDLGYGSKGLAVLQVQERLKELNYYRGELDGVWGQGTQRAVTAFQKASKIKADGIVGKNTYAKLFGKQAIAATPTPSPSPSPTPSPTPSPMPTPSPTPPPQTSIVLTFTGDALLGSEDKLRANENSFDSVVAAQGYAYPLANFRELFSQDDYTTVNLESVLKDDSTDKLDGRLYNFRGPTSFVNILLAASVEHANIANNHYIDYGVSGRRSTRDTLQRAGIAYSGYTYTHIFEKDGVKIGFAGIRESMWHQNRATMTNEIKALKKAGCDYIVYACHWGTEYAENHNDIQKLMATYAIDAGADCVIGTHPHVVQGVEVYNGKPIFYSLGNFVFGGNLNPTDYDGLVVQLTLHFDHQVCDDVQARLIPILTSGVQDGTTNFQPVMAEGEEKDRILNRIQQDSPAEISEIMTF